MATATTLTAFLNADITRFEKGMRNARKSVTSFGSSTKKSTGVISGAFSKLGIAIAAGLSTGAFIKTADNMTLLKARVDQATTSVGESTKAWNALNASALKTGTSLAAGVEIFQRLSFTRKEIGATVDEMLQFTETVQKLGVVSGASTTALKAGLLQLGQGLSSDILRAEEFNSIMENIPVVGKAIADEFGVSTGKLRQLVLEGKVASKDVFAAILNQTEKANEEFGKMPITFNRAIAELKNGLAILVSAIAKSFASAGLNAEAFSNILQKGIRITAGLVDNLQQAILGLRFILRQVAFDIDLFVLDTSTAMFNLSKAIRETFGRDTAGRGEQFFLRINRAAQQSANRNVAALKKIKDEAGDYVSVLETIEELTAEQEKIADTTRDIATEYDKLGTKGKDAVKGVTQAAKESENAFEGLGDTFGNAFEKAILGGERFSDTLAALGRDIEQILFRRVIGNPLSSAIDSFATSIFSGGGGGGGFFSSLFGSFNTGIDFVPRDMNARLHKGEAVMTAGELRSMRQGGGDVVVNVYDSDGRQQGQTRTPLGSQSEFNIQLDKAVAENINKTGTLTDQALTARSQRSLVRR